MSDFAEIAALDAAHVMQTYGRLPVAFVRGEGTVLWDSEGKRYLDFLAGAGSLNYGHNNPVFKQALVDYIMDDGITHQGNESRLMG